MTPRFFFSFAACRTLLFCLLASSAVGHAQTTPPASVEPKVGSDAEAPVSAEAVAAKNAAALKRRIDELSADDARLIVRSIQDLYISGESLDDTALARATAQGLIQRLGAATELLDAPTAAPRAFSSAFHQEVLQPDKIGYLRLGSLSQENIAALDQALTGFGGLSVSATILDLRATPPGSDFEKAAAVCQRFTPKGRILFTLRKPSTGNERILTSKMDPLFQGQVVVLIDSDTTGSAEVIAAVLRTHRKALIIGETSRGEAVEYAEVPVGGKVLRIAISEISLPDRTQVFPGGVRPDIEVSLPPAVADTVLQQALKTGVKSVIVETERPRMNEAALVAGINPELDALAAKHPDDKSEDTPKDAVIQRAVDAITAIRTFQ